MGRSGVDLYPQQAGIPLEDVQTFAKYLGGSATNVAVAAARYQRRTAIITRTGDDPFGRFVHTALRAYGVDDRYVTPVPWLPTPVTFCEIFPPDDFPLYFYRWPKAPDLEINPGELNLDAIRAAGVFWVTGTGLCAEPSRTATLAALQARAGQETGQGAGQETGQGAGQETDEGAGQETGPGAGRQITVLDLDYRAQFWPSREQARYWMQQALPYVSVAVGNLDECDTAVGEREPLAAARALHEFGVRLAIVKQGPNGVLASQDGQASTVPPLPVTVLNGLGAGDAFGGALCHGLLAGWDIEPLMRFANAAGALVASRLACSDAMPTAAEVAELMASVPREGVPPEGTSPDREGIRA
ncbi:MAG: 5-dehydro-2-deoxygluconokinase [Streptosporangiaceae bacterium]